MFARMTTVQVRLDKMDEAIQIFRDSVVPAAQAQKGYRTSYLLTDRATGKGVSVTVWESMDDLQSNDASAYYQAQLAKFAPLLTAAPVMEVFEISVQG